MRTAGWILIAVVAALTLVGSAISTWLAYSGGRDPFGENGPTIGELAPDRPDVALHVRARRATSAAYAAGWAVLMLLVSVGPLRRGEGWAAMAILVSVVVETGVVLLRVPLLHHQPGAAAASLQLGLVVVGLVLHRLGAPRTAP